MNLVFGHDPLVTGWVMSRIPHARDLGPSTAIGVASGDRLIAGVVFHAYRPFPIGGDVEITCAADSPMWAKPQTLGMLLRYPFVQLKCHRVTTIIPRKLKRARKFNEHMGFKLEGVVRKGFATDDACIYGLLRSEAERWLKECA